MKDPNDCPSRQAYIDLNIDDKVRIWEDNGADMTVSFDQLADFLERRQNILHEFIDQELEQRKSIDDFFETLAAITQDYNKHHGS